MNFISLIVNNYFGISLRSYFWNYCFRLDSHTDCSLTIIWCRGEYEIRLTKVRLTPYSLSYVFQDHLDWFTYRDGTRISHTEYSELERTYKGHRVQHPSCFHNYNKHNFCQIFWALKILHFLIFETYICSVWNLLNIYLFFYQNITSLAFFLWFF